MCACELVVSSKQNDDVEVKTVQTRGKEMGKNGKIRKKRRKKKLKKVKKKLKKQLQVRYLSNEMAIKRRRTKRHHHIQSKKNKSD